MVHQNHKETLEPSIRYLEGWNDILSEPTRRGLIEFNARNYFEQHEYLEQAWKEEPREIREMYQGILQIGVAFLQIERNNWRGAIKMFRRGLPKLRGLPDVCQGIQILELRNSAEMIHNEIIVLGSNNLRQFDQSRFPKIKFS